MAFSVKILLDSVSDKGYRLTTFEVTFPRIVLAELNTHREFTRSSASSRAIPVITMLRKLEEDPYVPSTWGSNQAGMQAGRAITGMAEKECIAEWNGAMRNAMKSAKNLLDIGVHKQTTNRLLEPFMWHTALISATSMDNFLHLRANPDAHPDIQTPALMMLEALRNSTPKLLGHTQWHMPLLPELQEDVTPLNVDWRKVSVGRCARVSYLTHDGVRDLSKDLELYDRLLSAGHMAPLEHVARPMDHAEYLSHFAYEVMTSHERVFRVGLEAGLAPPKAGMNASLVIPSSNAGEMITYVRTSARCGNYSGWVQHRKTVPREEDIQAPAPASDEAAQ